MRRRRLIVALAVGMAANLLVAWCCALWSPVEPMDPPLPEPRAEPAWPPGPVPAPHDLRTLIPPSWLVPTRAQIGGHVRALDNGHRGFGISARIFEATEDWPGLHNGGPDYLLHLQRSGWPFAALRCVGLSDPGSGPRNMPHSQFSWHGAIDAPAWLTPRQFEPRWGAFAYAPFPFGIEPIGFAANTAIYAAVAALLPVPFRLLLRRSRLRRNLCPGCAYNLSGLPPKSACPECGRPCATSSPERTRSEPNEAGPPARG